MIKDFTIFIEDLLEIPCFIGFMYETDDLPAATAHLSNRDIQNYLGQQDRTLSLIHI